MPDGYTEQTVHCRICGKQYATDFRSSRTQGADGSCCSLACTNELWWRRVLSLLGKPYRPRNGEATP